MWLQTRALTPSAWNIQDLLLKVYYNSSRCRKIVYLLSDGANFWNADSGGLVGCSGLSLGSCGIWPASCKYTRKQDINRHTEDQIIVHNIQQDVVAK